MKKTIFKFVHASLAIVALMALSRTSKAGGDECYDRCDGILSSCTNGCLDGCGSNQNCANSCTNYCLDSYNACTADCSGS